MSQSAPAESFNIEAEIGRLERDFYRLHRRERSALETIVARARATLDGALVGRSLALTARADIACGRHDAAIAGANAGLAALDSLGPGAAEANLAVRAELLRTYGNALLKLGRLSEAFPLFESAVAAGEAALAVRSTSAAKARGLHVLVRCLNNLGLALFAIHELDAAIDVYSRAAAIADPQSVLDDLLDDVLLVNWNRADVLHARIRRSRAAGDADGANDDVRAVDALLRSAGEIVNAEPADSTRITPYGRQGYYGSVGRHMLLAGRPAEARRLFELQIEAIGIDGDGAIHDVVVGAARVGLAEAALQLGLPAETLCHSSVALERFNRSDEPFGRGTALHVRAAALRALGQDAAAYVELEAYHALRERLYTTAAGLYARDTTARLGLERARAEAESQRRIAATLQTLGRIGQEITANLDVDAVVEMLHRHVGALLHAPSFGVWLLDAGDATVSLAFGLEDGRPFGPQHVALDHPRSHVALAIRERREVSVAAPAVREQWPILIAGTRDMQSALFIPLIVGDRVLGVLSIQSDRPSAYGENERSIARTLSNYGAIALDNAAAYRELAGAVATLQETQRELALRTAEFERLSMTDALTSVPNRRHFTERAAIETAEVRRNHGLLAVAMFDLDRFKDINDRYGHAVGDRVLQAIAYVAKDALRPADFLARIGGEEFALLLPGAGRSEAIGVAERIRGAVAKLALSADQSDVRVTASFGVADFGVADETFDAAFARADRALYRAKQNGRNRVESG